MKMVKKLFNQIFVIMYVVNNKTKWIDHKILFGMWFSI